MVNTFSVWSTSAPTYIFNHSPLLARFLLYLSFTFFLPFAHIISISSTRRAHSASTGVFFLLLLVALVRWKFSFVHSHNLYSATNSIIQFMPYSINSFHLLPVSFFFLFSIINVVFFHFIICLVIRRFDMFSSMRFPTNLITMILANLTFSLLSFFLVATVDDFITLVFPYSPIDESILLISCRIIDLFDCCRNLRHCWMKGTKYQTYNLISYNKHHQKWADSITELNNKKNDRKTK